jgi:hypothetical protein
MSASIVAPSGRVSAVKFTPPGVFRPIPNKTRLHDAPTGDGVQTASVSTPSQKPSRFALRSTVRYRVDRRPATGIIVGISHFDGFRYDIRPLHSAKSRTPAPVSFGVAHEDIEKLIAPPPDNQEVIVLSDLPPDTPQPVEQEAPRVAHNWLFGPAAWVATAVGLRAGSAPPLSPEGSASRS